MHVKYISDRFESPISDQAHGDDPSYRVEWYNDADEYLESVDFEYFDALPHAQDKALKLAEAGYFVRIDTAG